MKFGGTSVGSAGRIAATADIIVSSRHPAIIVLSAMSGATSELIEIARNESQTDCIVSRHMDVAKTLGLPQNINDSLRSIVARASTYAETVACGELMSTTIMLSYLQKRGIDAVMLPALDFMKLTTDGEPATIAIAEALSETMKTAGKHDIYVTQGFICRNAAGQVATLTRGGSDYTATLLGEALSAEEIQIWTDVDGVYSADPRRVPAARRVPQLSYSQADTAARKGAKILHPDCVRPAMRAGIPLRVLDSFHPQAGGTVIDNVADSTAFIAVAYVTDDASGTAEISLIGQHRDIGDKDILNVLDDIHVETVDLSDNYTSVRVAISDADKAMNLLHNNFIDK